MSKHVLVVDDSKLMRKMVISALPDSLVSDVAQAENGQEALDRYRELRPDVIFLDLNMPKMDGYDFLAAANREPGGLTSIVFVISADIQPQAQERVSQLGARAFLKKPLQKTQLAEILQQHGVLS